MTIARHTPHGTPYLTAPMVEMVAATTMQPGAPEALDAFIEDLGFTGGYVDDLLRHDAAGETVAKLAGQLCYLSFEPGKFTPSADTAKYLAGIMAAGHGSVLEHASVTLLFYGIDRSVTHELVRHRAGMAYSQVSQRYVGGHTLRFVERWEYQGDAHLHAAFERRIDAVADDYERTTEALLSRQKAGCQKLQGGSGTEARKHVRQVARSLLPNETEAPILVTGNLRAWRHCIDMRASEHADTAIRRAFVEAHRVLKAYAPNVFGDFVESVAPDGLPCLTAKHRKV